MGTPLSLFTGAWFSLFGCAVVWWCAVEVRLRRTLRRVGVSGMARVVAASEVERVPTSVGVGVPADADGSTANRDDADFDAAPGPAGLGARADVDHADADHADADQQDIDHADNAPLLSFEAEGHGEVITRPRGWTSIRRSSALAVGTLVPIAYDPQEPTRVALQGVRQSRSDLFWLLLGLAFAACGVALLATAF